MLKGKPVAAFIDTQKVKKEENEEKEEKNKDEEVNKEEEKKEKEKKEELLTDDFQMCFSPRRPRGCFHFWTGRQAGPRTAGNRSSTTVHAAPSGEGLSAALLAVSVRLPHPQTGSLAPSAGALHNTWRRSHEPRRRSERGGGSSEWEEEGYVGGPVCCCSCRQSFCNHPAQQRPACGAPTLKQ